MKPVTHAVRKHRRVLAWVAGLLCVYALVGFLVMPWLAERYLERTLEQRLAVATIVERLRFNPFTFSATLDDLALLTEQGDPLLTLDRLYLNLDPTHLLLTNLRAHEIRVEEPQLYITRYSETDDTLSRLVSRWVATAEDEPAQQGGLPEFGIGYFSLARGQVHYRDTVVSSGYTTELDPVDIEIQDFTTFARNEVGAQRVEIVLADDAKVVVDGHFTVHPLQLHGRVEVSQFSLITPYRYLSEALPVTLEQGILDVSFGYAIALTDRGPNVDISELHAELNDLRLTEAEQPDPLLSVATVTLERGRYAYPDHVFTADRLTLNDPDIRLARSQQGKLNWQRLLADSQTADESAHQDSGVQVNIRQTDLHQARIRFSDRSLADPVELDLAVNAQLQDFSLEPGQAAPLTANVEFETGGTVDLQGDLILQPSPTLQADVTAETVSLVPFQAYWNPSPGIKLAQGDLGARGRVYSATDDPFRFTGSASVTELNYRNLDRDEALFGWEALSIADGGYSLGTQQLALKDVQLDGFYVRVAINEQGDTNFGSVFGSPEQAANPQGPALSVRLSDVRLTSGRARFSDQSLPFPFDARITELNGSVDDFSTGSADPMRLQLSGRINDMGTADIQGTLTPLAITRNTTVEAAFHNIDLPPMTPYAVDFLGREITAGKGNFDLLYEIAEGNLNASNDIVIYDFALGDVVENANAPNLPLDLVIGLLESDAGVIEFEVPVSGEMDDPNFELGPAIGDAIVSVLRGIAEAPFNWVASSSEGEQGADAGRIRFSPGSSSVTEPGQKKLQNLAEALGQRPQLILEIPAPLAAVADREAMEAEAEEVTEEQLEQLARDRQTAVAQFLRQNADLDANRVQSTGIDRVEANEGELAMEFDLSVADD